MRLDENPDPASFARGIFDEIMGSTPPKVRSLDDRDKPKRRADTTPMNDITREELNAKLEAIEVKMDARVQAVSAKIDSFLSAQVERDKAWEKVSEARFDRIEKDISSIKADSKKIAEEINGLKVTMAKYLGAAIVIGAVASAILGAAAKNLLGS